MKHSIDARKVKRALQSVQANDPELAKELQDLLQRGETLDEAMEMASNLRTTGATLERFDRSVALETIVLRKGRPVLTIQQGDAELVFPDVESEVWRERLLAARPGLLEAIPAVGRIELENGLMDWVGTGWLVAEDIVVTNRHVAEVFGRSNGSRFTFRQGLNGGLVSAQLDVLEEAGRPEERCFELTEILHIEPEPGADMAFLRVRPGDRSGGLPNRIPLQVQPLSANGQVAVIGYPARDSRIPDQALMEEIFGNVYDKKRLAPGQVTRAERERLYHDCSTLGGCSGGVVIDLGTGQAVGLHFAGRYLESNYAVPISLVAQKLGSLTGGSRPAVGSRAASGIAGRTMEPPSRLAPAVMDGAQVITVPLQLRIRLDGAAMNGQQPILLQAGQEKEEPDFIDEDVINEGREEDYADREGYRETFLGEAFRVPLPEVVGQRWKDDVLTYKNGDTDDHVLRYQHFSVVMSRSRRLCFFSAVNIDGRRSKKFARVGWRTDPRIPKEAQILRECYGEGPKYSRGHMTRREDPVWGREMEAMQGNADSMVVTNTVPQMQAFNAPIWLALENYALDHARADQMRISIFTGPVFRSGDKVEYGVKIPVLFWKVIVFLHDETGELTATGYLMSQQAQLPESEFVFGAFGSAQVPLSLLEQKTGLSFGSLRDHDPLDEGPEAAMVPLADVSQIRFL